MVGTKSRGYSNLGQLSVGEYLVPFLVPVPALFEYDFRSTGTL